MVQLNKLLYQDSLETDSAAWHMQSLKQDFSYSVFLRHLLATEKNLTKSGYTEGH